MSQPRFQKRKPKGARNGFGTGTTSLLMIFTVLCFATLALLTLSTAASNARIQQRSFAGTAALAKAEGAAAEALARLDEALLQNPQNPEAVLLQQGWKKTGEEGRYQIATLIEAGHDLVTVIEVKATGNWQMVAQRASYTGEWTPAAPGPIWNGGN